MYLTVFALKLFGLLPYANSEDPDQTAPEGAVWLGSTLFAIQPTLLDSISR